MTQQDRNSRHILEQSADPKAARLVSLRAAHTRFLDAREAFWVEEGAPDLFAPQTARDAEYLTYLEGKLDPRD